jgi:creatinine amidohydrolase
MRKALCLVAASSLCATVALAQSPKSFNPKDEVQIDLLTHSEVAEMMKAGKTSVLIVAGGTEERGPHNVLGGHTLMARYKAGEIAKKLGNALVAPVLPVTPSATNLKEGTSTPGGMQVPPDVFKAIMLAEIESMSMNGFKDIYLMGDHGGGQPQMKEAAAEEDQKLASKGVRVYYIGDFYTKTQDDIQMYFYEHKLPIGGHGAVMETSEMLYEQPVPGMYVRDTYKTVPFNPTGVTPEEWKSQREARLARQAASARQAPATPAPAQGQRRQQAPPQYDNGLTGDPHPSTKEIGKAVIDICVNNSVAEIKKLTAERRSATQD